LVNARSISNKIPEFHILLNTSSIDIACVTETWLDSGTPDSIFVPTGYNVFRYDRKSLGGGVALFVKGVHAASHVRIDEEFTNIELVCIDVSLGQCDYRVIGYYRAPGLDSNDLDYMKCSIKCFQKLCATYRTIVLLGDFNLPKIDWSFYSGSNSSLYSVFISFINQYGFYQFVDTATRGENILDLVLSTSDSFVTDLTVISPFSNNDHYSVLFVTESHVDADSTVNSYNRYYYDFSNSDWTSLQSYFDTINWDHIFQVCFSVDACWNAFLGIVHDATDLYVPRRQMMVMNPRTRKYPNFIKKLIKRKKKVWKRWRSFRIPDDFTNYKELANECKSAIKKYHSAIETNLIRKNNLGSFYSFINRKLKNRNSVFGSLKSEDGTEIDSTQEKVELFNNFFASVFVADDGGKPNFPSRCDSSISIGSIGFTPLFVYDTLRQLKPSTSTGPDGIPNLFLKKLCRQLSLPLCHIFNESFQSRVLPNDWKYAYVTPLFKQGKTSNPSNYRPISLTATCCRVMERIINKQLIDYLLKNALISKHQHGFIRRRSTIGNLLESMQDWVINIDHKKITDVVYIDFKKAFDKVSHSKLLIKLQSYGICGNLFKWIESFLLDRTQSVKISDSVSCKLPILSGVPQGSVLGPILFLIYINDVVDCFSNLDVSLKLYADDLKLYSSYLTTSTGCDLNEALDRLYDWSRTWQLEINNEKCCVIRVSSGRFDLHSCPVYDIDGINLEVKAETKDLGITVDDKLKFDKHVSLIVHKAHTRANLILKCFESRDPNLLMKAFFTYVRPLLEYAAPVWSPHLTYLIFKVEQVQRTFTKRLDGLKNMSYVERLKFLGIHTLEHRRLISDLVFCYKVINDFVDIDLNINRVSNENYGFRGHNFKITKPLSRCDVKQYFFSSRVCAAWNALPTFVVNSCSVFVFKRQLTAIDLNRFLLVK